MNSPQNYEWEQLLDIEKLVRIIPDPTGIVQDEDFKRGSWVSAIEHLNANGCIVSGCLGDIKNFLKNGKLDQVLAIVNIDEGGYGKDITVEIALILANVSVFSSKPSMYYLNITMRNVLKVFQKDTVPGNGSGVDEEALNLALEEEATEARVEQEWLEKCNKKWRRNIRDNYGASVCNLTIMILSVKGFEVEAEAFEFEALEAKDFAFEAFEVEGVDFEAFETEAFKFEAFEDEAFEFEAKDFAFEAKALLALVFEAFEVEAFDFEAYDAFAFEAFEAIAFEGFDLKAFEAVNFEGFEALDLEAFEALDFDVEAFDFDNQDSSSSLDESHDELVFEKGSLPISILSSSVEVQIM
ncbi:hypothetical protein CTI12_AA484040 [Artemisia annua]|uniref:Homologous recombination OB-fold protein OB-fold domain-containing protein n=1 Tax=Artemisia annua TaxID=35608 RepID=A0A2U1LJI1_ARTAN|nr:hypothetical protein CTI12_AA484040 [Artemisia annua]